MKITALAIENCKKVKTVTFSPKPSGTTVIGGNNAAGKTSILDAIVYALGGEKMRPSNLKRDDSIGNPIIHIETDDGLIIERRGKNSELHVTDSTGRKAGQTLLDSLVSKFALDLPKFMNASVKEKTQMLLDLIPEKEALMKLDNDYKAKENTRLMVGREADKKEKAAEDLPFYEDAPEEQLSISELLTKQQEVLARNGARAKARAELENNKNLLEHLKAEANRLSRELENVNGRITETEFAIASAKKIDADEDTTDLEKNIADFESVNERVKANAARAERIAEAADLRAQYNTLSMELAEIKKTRIALLQNANLPYSGLSIHPESGELTLNGKSWDCMSGSQQLVVAASITSRMNPNCRFVLLDKTEQLDAESMTEFDKWCEEQDIQCICTRVSTGGECSLIIVDGEIAVNNLPTNEEEY
jgi:predicted ATP-dependent endonuclease of OLD family